MSIKPTSSLQKNPFFILGVTLRDNRHTIMERAEARSLDGDQADWQKARSDLTHPRVRLSAEIAWLPGVSPRMAEKLIASVAQDPLAIASQTGIPEIARANLMASALETIDPARSNANTMAGFMQTLGEVVDNIDPGSILRDVNEDRSVAGFPEVADLAPIEEELEARRRHYKAILKVTLNGMPSAMLLETMKVLVERSTESGESPAPSLIDDLVDSYQLETQPILENQEANIRKLIDSALAAAPSGARSVDPILAKLDTVVRNWCRISKPVQMSMKARGIDDTQSERLAYSIRNLGLELYNKHDLLAQAERTTKLLLELFDSLPELTEKAQTDAGALMKIKKDVAASELRKSEWDASITYHAQVGLVLKDDLSISPRGISWKGQNLALESVTHVRWGSVRHSVNGIPSGTDYTIGIVGGRVSMQISLRKEATYSKFVECLWRAVCVRLLYDAVKRLKDGETLSYGSFQIRDDSVRLTRHKFLSANEEVWIPYSQSHIWSGNGSFCIGEKTDKKVYGSTSYINDQNTHIVEHIIRSSFKNGSSAKLSTYWDN